MPGWDDKERYEVMRQVKHDEVRSYIEFEFDVIKYDSYDSKKHEFFKAFVINCGVCDGEKIDLFDLQEWFDKNRTWIDMLRQEVKE